MDNETFDTALKRVVPFLSELTDDFIVSVMDHDSGQPVNYLHGDLATCELLALSAQYEVRKYRDEVRDSESDGD